MIVPVWIWLGFISAVGCCVGSFLNVVIYRLPRDKSLITPPSACPSCETPIRFYDNIPLLSWLILGRKCRRCAAPISPRYFIIELFTGLIFAALFILYFVTDVRHFEINGSIGLSAFTQGCWLIYLLHICLLSAFIAASAIDLELWVIPISICWFVTAVGLIASAAGSFVISPEIIRGFRLLPAASPAVGALAAGGVAGLAIALWLLANGYIKGSYDFGEDQPDLELGQPEAQPNINHRLEMCREMLFLLPIIVSAIAALLIYKTNPAANTWWADFSQKPVITGLLGSLWGYFAGCGIVWVTRILGTLAFGKEAMGLGDVHLMGAAGAVIGAASTTVAFFIAPFFGLTWALGQMFFKKTRQIPYGPFLSLGVFVVMILHDKISKYLDILFLR